MKLYSSNTIREINEKYDFKMAKALGQNFLTDKNIIDEIIEGAKIGEGDLVIEIGPGIGVLTKEACEIAKKVIAIEIDKRLIPILGETLSEYDNFEIVNEDILKVDLKELIARNEGYENIRIIGNLPYYITTPIIMKILEEELPVDSITCMMQKEVADRISAPAGTRDAGAISIAVQFYCDVAKIAKAPKEAFVPRPKVDSAVLRFDVLKQPRVKVESSKIFFECVKNGFGKRRKTISNSLTGTAGITKELLVEVLEQSNIEASRRAETLTIEEFGIIADNIFKVVQ